MTSCRPSGLRRAVDMGHEFARFGGNLRVLLRCLPLFCIASRHRDKHGVCSSKSCPAGLVDSGFCRSSGLGSMLATVLACRRGASSAVGVAHGSADFACLRQGTQWRTTRVGLMCDELLT